MNIPTQLALELAPPRDVTQRWEAGHTRWSREGSLFAPERHEVAPISEALARPFVETHHYSNEFCNRRLSYGLFQGSELVGVAVLAVPQQVAILTNRFPALEPYFESLELGRFVLLDGTAFNAESWFLARMFELAYTDGIRGIVSFSDPCPRRLPSGELVFPGHIGQIYQATARKGVGPVIYSGRSKAETFTCGPDARPLSPRAISKLRNGEPGDAGFEKRLVDRYGAPIRRADESGAEWLERALVAIGAYKIRHPGKHRYLWALDRRVEVRATRLPPPRHIDPTPAMRAA